MNREGVNEQRKPNGDDGGYGCVIFIWFLFLCSWARSLVHRCRRCWLLVVVAAGDERCCSCGDLISVIWRLCRRPLFDPLAYFRL